MRIYEVFKITEKHMAYFVVDMMYNQKNIGMLLILGKCTLYAWACKSGYNKPLAIHTVPCGSAYLAELNSE